MSPRRRVAWALLGLGAAWGAVLLLAALTGGWVVGPVSVTTSKPLRFVLLVLFAGWFLLPEDERARLAARVSLRRVLAAVVAYGLLFRVTRWLTFDGAAFDLSLFESTLLHTLEGNFMWAWGLGRPLFSEHFEPIVLLFLPLYAVFHHPMVLLVGQALAMALAVVPLYRTAQVLGVDPRFPAAAYLLNPVVWQANKIDFHPELFAPLAIFWALHASVTRRWASLYAALLFALLIKEEMALVMLCFAPLVLRGEGRRWPHALAVGALAVAWGVFAFKVAMPLSHPAGAELHPLANRWAHLGSTYPQMVLGLLSRPLYVLGALFSEPMAWVFGSLGFVPLLDPASALLALPVFLLHLTGSYEYAAKFGAYYGLLGTCLLFPSLVFALVRVQKRFGARGVRLAGVVSLVVLPVWPFLNRPKPADLAALSFLSAIPEPDVVCAQSPLAPHRAPTSRLQMIPYCENPQWVLFATGHDRWPVLDPAEYAGVLRQHLDGGFEVAFSQGDYVWLKKKP